MKIVAQWQRFTAEEWGVFARSWFAELRGSPRAERELGRVERFARRLHGAVLGAATADDARVGLLVVLMNFTAAAEAQWQFVLAAVACAESDEDLGHVAAGPIEHLLGWHGEAFIDHVERQATTDPAFARALVTVHKYRMSDAVWARVQAIRARVAEP